MKFPGLISPHMVLPEDRAPYGIIHAISREENRGRGYAAEGCVELFFGPCQEEEVSDDMVRRKLSVSDQYLAWFDAIAPDMRFCTRYMQHDGTCFLFIEDIACSIHDFLVAESHAEYRDRAWKESFPGWYTWWDGNEENTGK